MCIYKVLIVIKSKCRGAVWVHGWLGNQELQALGIPCQPGPVPLPLRTSGPSGDRPRSAGMSVWIKVWNGHGCVTQLRQTLGRGWGWEPQFRREQGREEGILPQDNLAELLRQLPALFTEPISLWKFSREGDTLGPDIKDLRKQAENQNQEDPWHSIVLAPCTSCRAVINPAAQAELGFASI